eukprot:gb/GEZN01011471.1/.p1 GENE.gb/GEZN01011471.1/~~gb/GEZN01011471.1/.p1  ORF type:complete len:204 (-),score=43.92 gb/GEZN01011471.1/:511-1122(-)
MFEKLVVVDVKDHLLGRVASIIAKELLNGQKVVCVRCEELCISGSLYRNKLKWGYYKQKRDNRKPARGPFHQRAPSKMLFKAVRGMVPHKTARGQAAMDRLKVYEGVPHPFDKMKKKVIPDALRLLRLKPNRKYCRIGDLANQVGWKHDDLIKRLEAKRKTKAATYYNTKKELGKIKKQAMANAAEALAEVAEPLAKMGYPVA